MTVVLGVNAFHGDASAVALGAVVEPIAVAEERFTRVKHWAGFPREALRYVLDAAAGGDWRDVASLAVARKPRAFLTRKTWLALTHWRSLPRALRRLANLKEVGSLGARLTAEFGLLPDSAPRVHAVEHHLAHVASAYFASPFEEAACLTVDGFGDFVSSMQAVGRGNTIEVLDRVHFPHSVGLFYTALTQHLGFMRYGDEYKVMGLSAWGEARYAKKLEKILILKPRGRFALDLRYFRHLREGVEMTWEDGEPVLGPVYSQRLVELLGPARGADEPVQQRHRDLAASVQQVYEEALVHMVRWLVQRTGLRRLCLAGGCGQNSLANGKLYEQAGLDALFVQPAAGDDGTALGAALWVWHALLGHQRDWTMKHAYLGPAYAESAVLAALEARLPGAGRGEGRFNGYSVQAVRDPARLVEATARAIAAGEVVGWYQGRGEWGPRALGARSILADPRRADARELLNQKIKRRESFRPFAPSILEERASEWLESVRPDPFMTQVFPVRAACRTRVPAVVHADGTARPQTVGQSAEPRYRALIEAFERETGVPMVLNTSFNESEPIVNEPGEAIDCFLRTRMDRLVMGDIVVMRVAGS